MNKLSIAGVVVVSVLLAGSQLAIATAQSSHTCAVTIISQSAGIAVLSGDRRWTKLAHVMSLPYSLVFPFGTIAFYIVHSGLFRYL